MVARWFNDLSGEVYHNGWWWDPELAAYFRRLDRINEAAVVERYDYEFRDTPQREPCGLESG